MIILFEGMNGTGKSTLINQLAASLPTSIPVVILKPKVPANATDRQAYKAVKDQIKQVKDDSEVLYLLDRSYVSFAGIHHDILLSQKLIDLAVKQWKEHVIINVFLSCNESTREERLNTRGENHVNSIPAYSSKAVAYLDTILDWFTRTQVLVNPNVDTLLSVMKLRGTEQC
jgi:cytidylate kinase